MDFVEVQLAHLALRARLLTTLSPRCAEALRGLVPLRLTIAHDEWSGEMLRSTGALPDAVPLVDAAVPFQHPGLVVVERATRNLAICYGQGRLQDGFGPLAAIPLAQIGGDLSALAEVGRSLQFSGAAALQLSAASDQHSPLAEPPAAKGRSIQLVLGGVVAKATLLEESAPRTTAAFARLLPLVGTVTNTVSSGPLIRFWNPDGGPEGETPLDVDPQEPDQAILYPGYLYYLPQRPWRGIRIAARAATVMKGAVGGGGNIRLVPIARLAGDWSSFSEKAAKLMIEGAQDLRIEMSATEQGN